MQTGNDSRAVASALAKYVQGTSLPNYGSLPG